MINTENKVLGLLGLCAKSGKILFGTTSVEEGIQKRKVKLIIVASDCSEKTKNNFTILSQKFSIPIITFSTTENLSKCIGKNNKVVVRC